MHSAFFKIQSHKHFSTVLSHSSTLLYTNLWPSLSSDPNLYSCVFVWLHEIQSGVWDARKTNFQCMNQCNICRSVSLQPWYETKRQNHTPTPTHTDTKQHCQQSVCPPFPVCKKKESLTLVYSTTLLQRRVTYTPWVLTEFTIWPTSTTDKWKVFRYADCIMLWACSGELPFTIRTCWYI